MKMIDDVIIIGIDSGYGNIVRDLTGHGYDAVGGSSNPTMMDTKWN